MRTAFIQTLTDAAAADRRVTLVVGDLGFGVVTDFAGQFPDQFLNVGVAEQNMTSVAAGMALAGRIVFAYSIANFPTLRCLEQVRNDVCYQGADVTIVAVGGGVAYGALGATHHATEDLAVMRAMPGMNVIAPGDPLETAAATRAAAAGIGPTYLRLGRSNEPTVHAGQLPWSLGRAIRVREGRDLTLIATGGMLPTAVAAAEQLDQSGHAARVLSMHTLKPLDTQAVLLAARETGTIVTLEEHSIIGGLGGAVAETLCEAGLGNVRFQRIGLPSAFTKEVGDQEYLRRHYGLDVESVVRRVTELFEQGPRAGADIP